jgi:hypothetical protein
MSFKGSLGRHSRIIDLISPIRRETATFLPSFTALAVSSFP